MQKITLSKYIRYLGNKDDKQKNQVVSSTDDDDGDNSPNGARIIIQYLKTILKSQELNAILEKELEKELEELKLDESVENSKLKDGLVLFLNQIDEKIKINN